MRQEYTYILTFSRKTLFSYVHAMILEFKHINQTPQSLNSSIKVMHLLENQENAPYILQDSPPCLFVFSSKFPSFKSLNMGDVISYLCNLNQS